MLVRTEVARAAVYAAGAHLDDPERPGLDRARRAAPRSLAGEAAIANGKTATQVFGGMGFTWEVDVHLYLKRAWVLDTHFGSADAHCRRGRGRARGRDPDATVRLYGDMTRPQTTVLEALAQRLASDPDGPYLDFANGDGGSVQYTAREMDAESTRLAHALAALGVGHGDRVATLLENRAEQVVSASSRR